MHPQTKLKEPSTQITAVAGAPVPYVWIDTIVFSDAFSDIGKRTAFRAKRATDSAQKPARGHGGSEPSVFRSDEKVSVAVTRPLLRRRVAQIPTGRSRNFNCPIVEPLLADAFQLGVGSTRMIGVWQTGNCVHTHIHTHTHQNIVLHVYFLKKLA